MRTWIAAFASALAAASCGPSTPRSVAILPDGAKSAVLAIESGGSVRELYAFERAALDEGFPFPIESGDRVSLLSYADTLVEMQILPEGSRLEFTVGTTGRPLPRALSLLEWDERTGASWLEPMVLSEAVARVRLEAFDFEACADGGGCLRDASDPICVVPCPPVTAPDRPTAPAGPQSPTLPAMTPCRHGWSEMRDADGLTVCEPRPRAASMACLPGQVQYRGAAGCERLGRPCPTADDFPDDAAIGMRPVIWVRAGGSGDGSSKLAPFGSIAQAAAIAARGSVIAVARGTYLEQLIWIPAEVSLLGACVEGTIINSDLAPGIIVTGSGTAVADLTIIGGTPAVEVGSGELDLRSVRVGAGGGPGVVGRAGTVVTGGAVEIADRDGHALVAGDGAFVDLDRVVMANNTGTTIFVTGRGSLLDLSGVAVRGTRSTLAAANDGYAIQVLNESHAKLEGATIQDSIGAAVVVHSAASLSMIDAGIFDTHPFTGSERFGSGLQATVGAEVTLDGVVIDGAGGHGLFADSSTVTISDSIIRNVVHGELPGFRGWGVTLNGRATFIANRTRIESTEGHGLLMADSRAQLTDFVAADLPYHDFNPRTVAVYASDESDIVISRVKISRAVEGVLLANAARAEVSDLTILDGYVGDAYPGGLSVFGTTNATARRVAIVRGGFGLSVQDGATADVEDLTVTDGVFDPEHGGSAVTVLTRGGLTLNRARIERQRGSGVLALGEAGATDRCTSLEMNDVEIRGTIAVEGTAIPHASVYVDQAVFDANRVAISGGGPTGVLLKGVSLCESVSTIADFAVRENAHLGIIVDDREQLMRKVEIEGATGAGIFLKPDTVLRASHLAVRGTKSAGPGEFRRGQAIISDMAVVLELNAFSIDGNQDRGLDVRGNPSDLLVTDGELVRNGVGAAVFSAYAGIEYLLHLTRHVRYDNAVNFELRDP